MICVNCFVCSIFLFQLICCDPLVEWSPFCDCKKGVNKFVEFKIIIQVLQFQLISIFQNTSWNQES